MKLYNKEKEGIGAFIMIACFVLLFLWLIGSSMWSTFIKPSLGYFGIIEYKSKTLVRYESFLSKTSDCNEIKKVYSEKSSKYPVFHLFKCPDGEEVIWKYKVKVIRKASESRWILE